jgi:queuine tRNA-ribosyltransferase
VRLRTDLRFDVTRRDPTTRARTGVLHTPHGMVETPVFMPVGTAGTVKAIAQSDLESLNVGILLGNTYHLYLRPGHELIREFGGLHRFMGWPHAILTDSGGYQIMSLERLAKVNDNGYEFRSHLDGSLHFFSPERAVEIQLAFGSDIMMCLDQCVPYPSSHEVTARAMKLTTEWAKRCRARFIGNRGSGVGSRENRDSAVERNQKTELPDPAFTELPTPDCRPPIPQPVAPALFGIVQGGIDPELRRASAEDLREIGFEGYALGGLSVGEPKSATYDTVEHTASLLPADHPRYLMGVGTPEDLVECVARGVDMFDCVMPTRHARNGSIFTSAGRIVIKNARYARDPLPLDPACACAGCRRYSRAYLRHLFVANEMLGPMLATQHNLYFYLNLMREIREAIRQGALGAVRDRLKAD